MDDRTLLTGAVVLVEAPFLISATVLGAVPVPVPVTVVVLAAAALVVLVLRMRAEGRRVDRLIAEALEHGPVTTRPSPAAPGERPHHRPERSAS